MLNTANGLGVAVVNPHRDLHEALRDGLRLARKAHTQKSIARAIGVSDGTLSGFATGGGLGPDPTRELSAWLTNHGYIGHEKVRVSVENDPLNAAALHLEGVAASIRSTSGSSIAARAGMLRAGLDALRVVIQPEIDAYVAAEIAASIPKRD